MSSMLEAMVEVENQGFRLESSPIRVDAAIFETRLSMIRDNFILGKGINYLFVYSADTCGSGNAGFVSVAYRLL